MTNESKKDDPVQEKAIGLKASLDGCAQAFDAEQSRNYDNEEPCDEGVH
jgi:hypothetical protein